MQIVFIEKICDYKSENIQVSTYTRTSALTQQCQYVRLLVGDKVFVSIAWPIRGTYRAVKAGTVLAAWRGYPTLRMWWKNAEVHTLPPLYSHIIARTQFALPQNPEGPLLRLGLRTHHWASPQLVQALRT